MNFRKIIAIKTSQRKLLNGQWNSFQVIGNFDGSSFYTSNCDRNLIFHQSSIELIEHG